VSFEKTKCENGRNDGRNCCRATAAGRGVRIDCRFAVADLAHGACSAGGLARSINPALLPESKDLSPHVAIAALAYMLDWADGNGYFYVPRKQMMAFLGLSESTVKRVFRYWRDAGAIWATGRVRTANGYPEYEYREDALMSWVQDLELLPWSMRAQVAALQACAHALPEVIGAADADQAGERAAITIGEHIGGVC
jgi:hypothetical protein